VVTLEGMTDTQEESKEEPRFIPGPFAGNFPFSGTNRHLLDLMMLLSMQNGGGSTGTPPASKEVVDRLPQFKVTEKHCKPSKEGGAPELPNCAVCCNDISLGQTAQLLPCGHMFHPECTKPWLSEHNTCPVCRYQLPTDDAEYEERRRQAARQDNSAMSSQ